MATKTIIATGGGGNLPTTNELKVDITSKRHRAFGALTPLTTILSKLSRNSAHNFRIDMIEEHAMPTMVTVATELAADGIALVIQAHGRSLVRDTVLYNPRAYDYATVDTTMTSDTAITIARGADGSTGAIWKAGDPLRVLPPQLIETDANMDRAASVQDTNVFNYMQLIKMQFDMTRTLNDVSTVFGGPGSKQKQLKQQKYREFREKGEWLRWVGGRSSSGTAPDSLRSMGGMTHFLRGGTLYKDFGGLMTETGLVNWFYDYKSQNPDATNIAYVTSGKVLQMVNRFAQGNIRISPNAKKYGLNLKQWDAGPLKVDLLEAPLFNDKVTKGWGFLIDWSRIELNDLSPVNYYPDIKSAGESEIIHCVYRESTSMRVANESRHAMHVDALL